METSSIDTTALPRIEADVALVAEAGLKFEGPLLFAEGTVLYDSGVAAAKRSRVEFDQRPLLVDAALSAQDAYLAQDRRDYSIDLRDLGMSPSSGRVGHRLGAFQVAGTANAVGINQIALGQLMSKLGAEGGAASYLVSCPVALRAENVNSWLNIARNDKAKDGSTREFPAKVRTLIDADARRQAYAVLAPGYNVRDLPQVLPVFQEKLAGLGAVGARGDYKLAGAKWKFTATFHSAIESTELRVGDVFRGAVWVSGSDDGTGSVKVGVGVERARCRNLTTVWAREVQGLRHNSRDFDRRLGELLQQAVKAIGGFAEKWAAAEREGIIDGVYGGEDPAPIFAALVKKGLVKLSGVSREEMVEKLVAAWRVEPGYQRTDIVNAVTRAAHESSWSSPWAQEELESQGGQLLYNRVVLSVNEVTAE